MASLDLVLSRADSLSGEPCPLQARVQLQVEPPLPEATLAERVSEALEAAIGLGQSRYHLYRDEMPSRRAAVQEAARAALAMTLERDGHELLEFALLGLEAVSN